MEILPIGSFSHGTLKSDDIADAILRNFAVFIPSPLSADLERVAFKGDAVENAPEIIAEAFDVLQDYAPVYCYVGAHIGDGSDFGVWPSFCAVERAVQDGEAIKVCAGASDADIYRALAETGDGSADIVIKVNDHGNIAVHAATDLDNPLWDCV